jgi:hypothetical protein
MSDQSPNPWFVAMRIASREVFPAHKCELALLHNPHKNLYQTVAQAIENNEHGYKQNDWVSIEQRNKAIETNDCWMLQWYPDAPVGFCLLTACDLDVLLRKASEP